MLGFCKMSSDKVLNSFLHFILYVKGICIQQMYFFRESLYVRKNILSETNVHHYVFEINETNLVKDKSFI